MSTDLTEIHSHFTQSWNTIAADIHATNIEKGWWDQETKVGLAVLNHLLDTDADPSLIDAVIPMLRRNDGEALMLIVTEVAEVLEGLRDRNPPSEKIGAAGFTQAEEEMADVVIRVMDLCCARNWRVAEAIKAKLEYNRTRPFRHGGRVC